MTGGNKSYNNSDSRGDIDEIENYLTNSTELDLANSPDEFDVDNKWVRRYLAYRTTPDLRQKRISNKTASTYETRLREWVNFVDDLSYSILEVEFEEFMKYLYYCIELGRRTNTIMNRVSTIKGLYKYLEVTEEGVSPNCSPLKFGEIQRDAVDELTPNDLQRDALSKEDVEELFAAMDSTRDRLMAIVGTETGFRNSDIRGIRLIDLDLDEPVIEAHNPKYGRAYTVPISEDLALELDIWIRNEREALLGGKDSYYLFPSSWGGMIETNHHLGKIIRDAAESAGIQKVIGRTHYETKYMKTDFVRSTWHEVMPHALRHTFITLLEKQNVPIEYRQMLANHKSSETTQGYSHGKKDVLEQVQNRINLDY
jgi:integrase/recombinase XerD